MSIRNYVVRIETDAEYDVKEAMDRTVEWLAETLDPSGEHALTIDVSDGIGNFITGHYSTPGEEEGP